MSPSDHQFSNKLSTEMGNYRADYMNTEVLEMGLFFQTCVCVCVCVCVCYTIGVSEVINFPFFEG